MKLRYSTTVASSIFFIDYLRLLRYLNVELASRSSSYSVHRAYLGLAVLIYWISVICYCFRSTGGETRPEGQCEGLLEGTSYFLVFDVTLHALMLRHDLQSSGHA